MTSLIDVIFLLLLFFMLSSTFSRFADVELSAAGASRSASTSDAPVSFMQLGNEAISLNGQEVAIEGLADFFAELPEDAEALPVIISLRDDVTAQRLTDILVVLRGIDRVAVNVLGT